MLKRRLSVRIFALVAGTIVVIVSLHLSSCAESKTPDERSKTQTVEKMETSVTASVKMESATAKENLKEVKEKASYLGVKIFFAVALIFLAFLIIKAVLFVLTALSERAPSYRFIKKLGPLFQIMVWAAVIYIVVLFIFQPEKQTFFAFLTASGVAIGFAAQDVLKNVFGGLTIILDRPFQVGDKIKVGEYCGEVVEIGIRSTRIVTPNDSVVSIPNSEVVSKSVSNANSGALDCQVVTEIVVPSHVDLAQARRIAWEAAVTSQFVHMKKPVSILMVDAPTERAVRTKLKVKAYVIDTRLEYVLATDIIESVKGEFQRRGYLKGDDLDDARNTANGLSGTS